MDREVLWVCVGFKTYLVGGYFMSSPEETNKRESTSILEQTSGLAADSEVRE